MKHTINFIRYRLEYAIFIAFKAIFLCFSQKKRFEFAEWLGGLAYRFLKTRSHIALANLKLAFPELTDLKRNTIARKAYGVMARGFLCSLWFREYVQSPGQIRITRQEISEAAYKKGRGVIGITMHTGILDLACYIYKGKKLAAVAKAQRNPLINRFITKSREEDLGITIVPKTKHTTKDLLRYLKNGYILGLLSDHRDKGTTVNFFGKKTIAPTGAISLALKYDIPVIFVHTVLRDDNVCEIIVEEELELSRTENFKEDVQQNTQMVITKMEQVIRMHPEQWMWFHDRWKLKKTLL